jgi:hypothetical protein
MMVDEGVRPRDIVIGDVLPELDPVIGGSGTLEDDAHLGFGDAALTDREAFENFAQMIGF